MDKEFVIRLVIFEYLLPMQMDAKMQSLQYLHIGFHCDHCNIPIKSRLRYTIQHENTDMCEPCFKKAGTNRYSKVTKPNLFLSGILSPEIHQKFTTTEKRRISFTDAQIHDEKQRNYDEIQRSQMNDWCQIGE